MKKIFSTLFIMMLCVLVVSCGSDSTTQAGKESTTTQPHTIIEYPYQADLDWPNLHLYHEASSKTYEKYEAYREDDPTQEKLTPSTLLCVFIQDTDWEGIAWYLYATEEYPDQSYILMDSGNSAWVLRLKEN